MTVLYQVRCDTCNTLAKCDDARRPDRTAWLTVNRYGAAEHSRYTAHFCSLRCLAQHAATMAGGQYEPPAPAG